MKLNNGASGGPENTDKNVIFKNCALFTSCIIEINNTQVDDAQETDMATPMQNRVIFIQ